MTLTKLLEAGSNSEESSDGEEVSASRFLGSGSDEVSPAWFGLPEGLTPQTETFITISPEHDVHKELKSESTTHILPLLKTKT